jgi:hypothetical protein
MTREDAMSMDDDKTYGKPILAAISQPSMDALEQVYRSFVGPAQIYKLDDEMCRMDDYDLIPHNGGAMPVAADQRVLVETRLGQCWYGIGSTVRWEHDGGLGDVMAYRVVEADTVTVTREVGGGIGGGQRLHQWGPRRGEAWDASEVCQVCGYAKSNEAVPCPGVPHDWSKVQPAQPRQHISDAAWKACERAGIDTLNRSTHEAGHMAAGLMLVTVQEWDAHVAYGCDADEHGRMQAELARKDERIKELTYAEHDARREVEAMRDQLEEEKRDRVLQIDATYRATCRALAAEAENDRLRRGIKDFGNGYVLVPDCKPRWRP